MTTKRMHTSVVGEQLSTDADSSILHSAPYMVSVTIVGVADLLFHAWSVEAVAEKSAAKKGSKAKKEDNLESYLYRDDEGLLGIPGENFRQSIIEAARYLQDPRSPRKSARDLFKAGLVSLTKCASLGVADYDYLDRRRVTIQRQGITRIRPAMLPGWTGTFVLLISTPEYISLALLTETIVQAGRLIGLCDFRPSYGRFQATHIQVVPD